GNPAWVDAALASVGEESIRTLRDAPLALVRKAPRLALEPALVRRLAKLLGRDAVVTDPARVARYGYDQCWLSVAAAAAGKPLGRPKAVVRPKTVEDVQRVLELASRTKIPVTPWGGGSGGQGAAVAHRRGIV